MKNLFKNLWSVLTFPFVSLYMYFAGGKSSATTDATTDATVDATSGDAVIASSNQKNIEPDALNHLLQKNLAENKPKATSKNLIMAGCVAGFALLAAFAGSSESTSPMPPMVK